MKVATPGRSTAVMPQSWPSAVRSVQPNPIALHAGRGLIRAPVKAMFWVRKGDGRRFAAIAAILIAILTALFLISPLMRAIDPAAVRAKAKAAQALAKAAIQREAQARAIGSIVFASDDRLCEELQFDNRTGRTLAIKQVDCESRLAPAAADPAPAPTAGMRDMLSSFRR